VNEGAGIGLITGGVALSLITVFALWRRVAGAVAFGLLAVAGVGVGTGALLVQDQAGAGEWIITLGVLGVLTPVHMRLVFGHPGGGVVAEPPPAA
jgi:hypothetical protein